MKRWLIPIIYFVLCESLDLLYELGLSQRIDETIGIMAVLALIMISFPAASVGQWVQNQIAFWQGFSPADAIAYNSFWPRFLGMQSSILICTLALTLVITLITTVNPHSKRRAQ